MKKFLSDIVLIGAIFLSGCQGNETLNPQIIKTDSSYAVIGKVTGQDTGWIYILHHQSGNIDSARLDHGYFTFAGKADTAEFCRISLDDNTKSFFLENGKISMLIKKDSLRDALISGTPVQDEFNYFQNVTTRDISDSMAAINRELRVASIKKNKALVDRLNKVYDSLDLKHKKMFVDYMKSHPVH